VPDICTSMKWRGATCSSPRAPTGKTRSRPPHGPWVDESRSRSSSRVAAESRLSLLGGAPPRPNYDDAQRVTEERADAFAAGGDPPLVALQSLM